MSTAKIRSFKPILDNNSRVLILGSMPGVQSLRLQQYYGHPQNQFWRIIFALFNMPEISEYENKLAFLREKRIALWDSLEACYRKGSSDSDIAGEKVNNFIWLFKKYPHIHAVFFNGAKAYETFRKIIGFEILGDRFYKKNPSTSPANNAINFESKLKEWSVMLEYLPNKPEQGTWGRI